MAEEKKTMGLQFGLNKLDVNKVKRPFRWMFEVPQVCGDQSEGVNALPPSKAARPTLAFKEMSVNHLVEDVYYPAKPDWRPINITVYDIKRENASASSRGEGYSESTSEGQTHHPVFNWLQEVYKVKEGKFLAPLKGKFIKECSLKLLDGEGCTIERWIFETAWPNNINFDMLDMANSTNILTCEFTLRYARAYIDD